MLKQPTATEKLESVGMPVVTVSWLDCVEMGCVALVTVAKTRTEVATVPAFTTVCARPWLSLVALADVNTMPPTDVFSEKVTVAPVTGPLDASRTRNTTVEASGCVALPVPWSAMLSGVAETNSIEPTVAAAAVIVPFADRGWLPTVAVAVMTSEPEQPEATYVTVARPV